MKYVTRLVVFLLFIRLKRLTNSIFFVWALYAHFRLIQLALTVEACEQIRVSWKTCSWFANEAASVYTTHSPPFIDNYKPVLGKDKALIQSIDVR